MSNGNISQNRRMRNRAKWIAERIDEKMVDKQGEIIDILFMHRCLHGGDCCAYLIRDEFALADKVCELLTEKGYKALFPYDAVECAELCNRKPRSFTVFVRK